MKISDIRNIDDAGLSDLLYSLRKELFDLTMRSRLVPSGSSILQKPRILRKDISRILGELRSRDSKVV